LNTLIDHSTKELLDAREAVNKTWGLTRDAIHGKNNEADLKKLADALDNDLSNLDLKIKVRLTRADEAGEHNILQQAKHDSNTAILEISKTKALAERELENLLQEQATLFSFSPSLSMDDFDALTEWCDNFNQWRSAENKTLSLVESTSTLMQECDTQQCKLISLIRAAKRDTHPLEIDQNSSLAETLLYVKSEASKLEAMLLKAESSFTAKNALVEEISRLHHDQKHQQALTLDIEDKIKQQVNGSWLVSENTAHVINNWSAIKLYSDQQSKLVQLKSELTQVCSALNSTDQQVIRLCKLLNIETSTDKLANLQLLVDKYDSYIKYEATQSNKLN